MRYMCHLRQGKMTGTIKHAHPLCVHLQKKTHSKTSKSFITETMSHTLVIVKWEQL